VKAGEALRLLRVREWFYFLVLPLAGQDAARAVDVDARALARGLAVAFGVLGFGYLVNAAADAGSDPDARKNPLAGRTASRSVGATCAALAGGAIALAATGPRVALVAAVVCVASGLVYSVGPRLKSVPVVGTLANATNFVPLLFVGAASPHPSLAWRLTPVFAGVLLQSQILHEAADARADDRGGVRTTFLAFGRVGSALLAALFGALPLAGSELGAPVAIAVTSVFVAAFPLALAVYATDSARAMALRRWQRGCGLVLGAAVFLRDAGLARLFPFTP
jgi:4-hydroxybenzoate polyprenyltransferase